MIHFLFLLISGSEVNTAVAHNDSVLIYNAYKGNIEVLKNATNIDQWYAVEDSLSRLTACSFFRLSKFNKHTYRPIDEFNREGMGVAYLYPEPAAEEVEMPAQVVQNEKPKVAPAVVPVQREVTPVAPPAVTKQPEVVPFNAPVAADHTATAVVESPKAVGPVAFTVLEHQTHFLVSNNGKTKTPYIEMFYYAKGRVLVKTEKINPITLKPLEIPQTEVKQAALVVSSE